MLSIIQIENLCKSFKVLNRHQGFGGAVRDLFSRDYKIVKAVDNISMSIDKGEMVGFVGPNGAGKSTTIKMMTGVLEPTSGSIKVDNFVPYKQRMKYVQNIGVVFGQRTQLWWELPVIESFRILKEIFEIDDKTYNTNMGLFNDLVGLDSLHSTPVRFLSLGQRMLCDIVAAFLHNPKIIFLDEPTIGLDVSIKNKIRGVIKELNTRNKTTILLTTHDISDLEILCKRIIIVDKGSTIFDGDIQKVNSLFGAYRVLRLEMSEQFDLEELSNKIKSNFKCRKLPEIEASEDGWINITINLDEIKLVDMLNYLLTLFPLKDIKVEEVPTEKIIREIYEGGLK
ncbi:ATP-binding cassette domain-containing protein [Pseudobacteroides cellulosolvens]|uniref:ABC transporter ATP-binding protein n=1 Tax=Pseudobacteroides cellulosolvens TaxID=35825 RepID=UPI002ADE5E96|nr:ATP-binding cassette domain-containing protein [Pseudobacteroides cellulosolvens]